MNFTIEVPLLNQSAVCEPILRALPDWFSLESATQAYIAAIQILPTCIAKSDTQPLGFLSLKQHNPYSAEVYMMGVRPEAHRLSIGKALMQRVEMYAREQGIEYLQVKTLGPSHSDEGHAKTRAFYAAMDFRPLEEITQLWDEHNPCLIMVKRI